MMKTLVRKMFNQTYIPKVRATYASWVSDTYDTETGTNIASYSYRSILVYITDVKVRGTPTGYVITAVTSDDLPEPSINDKLTISAYKGATNVTFAVSSVGVDSIGALTSITLNREGVTLP